MKGPSIPSTSLSPFVLRFLTSLARRRSKHSAKPFEGKVHIDRYSSLRKRMRAARRGLPFGG